MLKTERLFLRSWEESDVDCLYEYAKDPDVGPIAGWPAHQSIQESRRVLQDALSGKETYAICLKTDNRAIGAVGLKMHGHSDLTESGDECELGYWLGQPFWGQGIMTEAVKEVLRHAFEDIGMLKVWVGYYEGNLRSKRIQEKCRFRYQWSTKEVYVPLMKEKRTGHVSSMTKDQWEWDRLFEAADAVRKERTISEYITCGEVSAAVLSKYGNIYTGVCIDTCSTLGICAERNAIFNMITNGEQEIRKVIAILPDGSTGAPCGACRELMVQLMPDQYKNVEIMMNLKQEKIMTLGELTPKWWI